jgi:tRNA G18 (ribose-2'-O)-methylase SpoU
MRKLTFEEITQQRYSADEMQQVQRFPVYVILENIRSMYNVGAMFRTSDAACVQELIICGYTARPPRKEIDKTALGATETVPWRYVQTGAEAVKYLKEQGVYVIALEHCENSRNIMTMTFSGPVGLVVGNEVDGVSQETISVCDCAAEIPMFGMKQSLNAAVAYGIAVFQLIQHFQNNK